ncbi:hypothetical protein PR003_g26267 [Phytophthora rubi]|uniref:Uncharacterized protein n=1 Tax=Phytophthora rubi TaxID=129364 RepID=A0A6A3I4U4_9STRA|nr:hypothetical protein PR002_g25333 [Phytophthora rubi]KAE8977929.1 hypothetical protein PR001_g24987 [Phytophthora rubi]KAE9286629.1 hypothetical protein PR003_g26267 [Phytophthora rubi]
MPTPVQVGALAFIGPAHASQLSDFQYVEVVSLSDTTAEVKITGPDSNDEAKTFAVATEVIGFRLVPDSERRLWSGSYIAHPVAFILTSTAGVDEWAYGVVSGYTASDMNDILHIVSPDGPTRFPLTDRESVIKVDPLNYALRPGQGANVAAISPMELLHQQNALLGACGKRKAGIPAAVLTGLSVPFSPDELVPLVNPSTLGLVQVRRQHIVEFATATRANRPADLYTDQGIATADEAPPSAKHARSVRVASAPGKRRKVRHQATEQRTESESSDDDDDNDDDSDLSEVEDINEVQHMNAPLTKRQRLDKEDYASDNSTEASPDEPARSQRGIVFYPSPTERRVHAAIVNRRHKGKVAQTLLQSVQQSPHVDFLGSPAVLRGLHSFEFSLGLSIMHCRRVRWDDEVATSEKGVNLWDFSSKNGFPTPPKATSCADLISALTALYKFGQHFYNSETVNFIGAAKDFIIDYSDHARPDPTMARLLVFWINSKFSLFRNTIPSEGLSTATKVSVQFCRSDDKLAALRDSSQTWKVASTSVRSRATDGDKGPRGHRTPGASRIPSDVYSQLPKADDGRRLCLKYLSATGSQFSKCSSAHFRPEALPDGARKVIMERWGSLGTQFSDL